MNKEQRSKQNDIRERTYTFSLQIIKLVGALPNKPEYWPFRDQLLRSGTSIGSNCVEAVGVSSRKEFGRYNEIALRSAQEARYWLNLLKDSRLVEASDIDPLIDEVNQLCKMLYVTVKSIKNNS